LTRHRSVVAVPILLGLAACSTLSDTQSASLGQVDDLLGRVEALQVEALVSKEQAHAAYDALHAIVAPEFQGDPLQAYTQLVQHIEHSRTQAQKFGSSIPMLKSSAENVFLQWTINLESFGNTKLRQQSQSRLAETRARYEAIITAATSAQVAYDALNSDFNDNALFLKHDFNAAAVHTIAMQVEGLTTQVQELDLRLDAAVLACKGYVEHSALRGQLSVSATELTAEPPQPATQTAPAPRRKARTTTTLPPPQPEATPAEPETTPQEPVAPIHAPAGGTPPQQG